MLTRVRKTIEAYRMLHRGDHVLIGVSGGGDSVALLAVLQRLGPPRGVALTAAHFNHATRAGESDRDEAFVRKLCEERNVPLLTGSLGKATRTAGLSVEDFLRRERYAFFDAASRKTGANRVALGHHRGDQAETVLMNILRGSGLSGLGGIPPVRDDGRFIRPLIDCPPDEIADYLEKQGLPFITDSSNADERFLRNRVRNTLLPELERLFNPAIVDSLCRLADVFRQEDDYITRAARLVLEPRPHDASGTTLPVSALAALHPALRRRVVLEIVRGLSGPDCSVGLEHVQAVLHLAEGGRPSGSLDLPGGLLVRRNYGSIDFRHAGRSETRYRDGRRPAGARDLFRFDVPVPGTIRIESLAMSIRFRELQRPPRKPQTTARRAYLDLERVSGPLVLRSAEPGDRIQPLGMKGTRKLNRLFIDEKIPRFERGRIPLLADEISILWVPGLRLSERVRVAGTTRRVLKAEII